MKTELEHMLASAYKVDMIPFLESHPEYFEEAIALALSNNQPFSWRAAWLLADCMDDNDQRVKGHIAHFVGTIQDRADGHQREFLKILLRMDLSETHEGRLFDTCMGIWEQVNKSPSVRFTAFKFIVKIAKKYPELSNEIAGLTQEWHLETLSPGVRRSISRLLLNHTKSRANG